MSARIVGPRSAVARFAPCLLALATAAAPGRAETITVPGDFASIQLAVDSAVVGTEILVSAGTYVESVVITGQTGVVLRAKGKVVIDAPGAVPGLTIDQCEDIDVIGFRVVDGAADGIVITDSVLITLVKCRVADVLGTGIFASGTDGLRVESCRVDRPGENGIVAGGLSGTELCPNAVIRKCRVAAETPLFFGVLLGGHDGLVEKCRVDWPGGSGGLQSGGPEARIDFRDCRVFGSSLVASVNQSEVTGCRVTGEALILDGTQILAEDNRVIGGFIGTGFGTSNTIRHNVVLKAPHDFGLLISLCTNAVVEDNLVKGCEGGALFGFGSDGATVTGNVIKGSLGDGMLISASDGTWDGNAVLGSGGDGFVLDESSSGNTLTGNKAKGSDGFDLRDDSGGANVIAEDNHFETTFP